MSHGYKLMIHAAAVCTRLVFLDDVVEELILNLRVATKLQICLVRILLEEGNLDHSTLHLLHFQVALVLRTVDVDRLVEIFQGITGHV